MSDRPAAQGHGDPICTRRIRKFRLQSVPPSHRCFSNAVRHVSSRRRNAHSCGACGESPSRRASWSERCPTLLAGRKSLLDDATQRWRAVRAGTERRWTNASTVPAQRMTRESASRSCRQAGRVVFSTRFCLPPRSSVPSKHQNRHIAVVLGPALQARTRLGHLGHDDRSPLHRLVGKEIVQGAVSGKSDRSENNGNTPSEPQLSGSPTRTSGMVKHR